MRYNFGGTTILGDTHINIVGDVEYNSRTDEAKVGGGFTINVDL